MTTINCNQPVGLALGSGAARGLAHIGVLRYFEHVGIEVGWIAGSSIGALVGAAYATGMSSDEMIQIMEHLDRKKLVKLFSPMISTRGVVSGRSLVSFFRALLGNIRIEDLKIPFCAVATDFHTGERVVISEGELTEAVRASISIPVIFHPVEIGKHTLVDGGLVDPVPVEVVKQMGATQIIAVSVSKSLETAKTATEHHRRQSERILPVTEEHGKKLFSSMLYQRMSGFLRQPGTAALDQASDTSLNKTKSLPNMVQALWQTAAVAEQEITRLRLQIHPPDVVIRPDTSSIQSWDFTKIQEAVQAGEYAAKIALESLIHNQKKT